MRRGRGNAGRSEVIGWVNWSALAIPLADAAQFVDDPSQRYHGQTLEGLMKTVERR
jgi:hypothetical protein